VAVQLPQAERELEQQDGIEEAVLTLATPDEVCYCRKPGAQLHPCGEEIKCLFDIVSWACCAG
jgi:hypothetical protein